MSTRQCITSTKNPLIQKVGKLIRKKGQDRDHIFVEGLRLCEMLIDLGHQPDLVLYDHHLQSSAQWPRISALLSRLRDSAPQPVSHQVAQGLTLTQQPQGLVMLVKKDAFVRPADKLLNQPIKRGLLVLNGIQDPGNLGTILRTAEAFGVDGVVLDQGTCDPFNPKVIRATMGAVFAQSIYTVFDLPKWLLSMRHQLDIVGTALEDAIHLPDFIQRRKLFSPVALVLGNEGQGLSESVKAVCDHLIYIPMIGQAESLNVGVAAGIMAYEFFVKGCV